LDKENKKLEAARGASVKGGRRHKKLASLSLLLRIEMSWIQPPYKWQYF